MQSTGLHVPFWGAVSLILVVAVGALPRSQAPAPAAAVAQAAAPAQAAAQAVGQKITTAAAAIAAIGKPAAPAFVLATPPQKVVVDLDANAVRARMKYETERFAGKKVKTLDEASRILLAQAAAQHADLEKVGLTFADVYGVIEAETSWIPRTGLGRNGVRSYGLAQFEPGTAKGLGLKNPNDPVDAVFAAAVNLRHGATWAAKKIVHLDLTPEQRARKLREGVSVYYNLSVKGRNKWDGQNTAELPIETRRHIRNVKTGAREAEELAEGLDA